MSNKMRLIPTLRPEQTIAPPLSSTENNMKKHAVEKTTQRVLPEGILEEVKQIILKEDQHNPFDDNSILLQLQKNNSEFSNLSRQDISYARNQLDYGTAEQRKK